MSRKRIAWFAIGGAAAAILLAALAGLLVVRSSWFRERVHRLIVSEAETATGGRVEVGSFAFDWRRMRAEVGAFVIHGKEPADHAPLFRARSIAVGLKIVSVFRRKVDIEYLDVAAPEISLIVYPDGSTNVPEPKVKKPRRNAAETILDLAIGRFSLQNGAFAVVSEPGPKGAPSGSGLGAPSGSGSAPASTVSRTPFDLRGRNLNTRFAYELAGPRYRGEIHIQPLELNIADYAPTAAAIDLAVTIEKNRVGIASAALRTGDSRAELSGAMEDFASPRGSFQYQAQVSQADVARFLHTKLLESGTVQAGGNVVWKGGSDISVTGNWHAYNLEYRDAYVRLRDFRADGALAAVPGRVDVSGIRLSGFYVRPGRRIPVDGRIVSALVRAKVIELGGVALAGLGGSFHGKGRIEELNRFQVEGEIAGFQARRVVAVYSSEPLPWDGRASGPVHLEGSLRGKAVLRISANLAVTPEPGGPPVHGQVTAAYDTGARILDLGRSTLTLPSSRVDFSGALGREMRAHLETRDLNDLLPAIGESAASVPVALQNGVAVFDGTVTGPVEDPRIAGRLSASRFAYSGMDFDSLAGDVTASPQNVRMDNATLVRGALRAQFQAAVALREWKTEPESAIFGSASMSNAPVAEAAMLLNWKDAPLAGMLNTTAKAAGTVSHPILESDVEVSKGAYGGEPFDRFTAHAAYSANTLDVTSGRIVAGAKQASLTASYSHSAASFDTGRLRLHFVTNAVPLDQIATLEKSRPGILGTVHATADATFQIRPAAPGQRGVEILALDADAVAQGLQLTGQPLGDAHLTAKSQGQTLRAHLESDFANSAVRGDGEWRLEGDYPGTANITFSRLDFAQLRAWIAPSKGDAAAGLPVTGSAEGVLRIDGPALRPQALKAELRIPKFELAPAPGATPTAGAAAPLVLHNTGPVVVSMANSIVTIESARLQGRLTDVTVAGRALLDQKNPLDLRVNGRVDLGILQDFYPDLTSTGTASVNASVRGTFDSPQIAGRVDVQNGSATLADFPNGLSNANGVVAFSGSRATIEKLTAESGGGQIDITGFMGYGAGQNVGLHAEARQVRVRYPEGVSTVANANLNLTGTSDRSLLSGTITVLRTGFNPQSDFSSLLARSAEPVRTPSARTGLLGGLNFDIQVQTDPNVQVLSSLTQDIGVEANLRLRGTVSNPAVLGRVNITQGEVLFFGTRYAVNQGSIAFFNQVKVEPIVNIDLETKAKGIDVILTVSGPLGKLNLTPRSDPPLQFNEIVALLATGQAPTSDPALLARQTGEPQSWQQMGASALLGQAINSSPVAGRLQRFFGVSRLRIDPTLTGLEYNPQARITLEEQITPQLTFTYITVVNSSNPQVISVEWDVSKQWSVVAVREENGQFGLDFFFKRQFRSLFGK
jgi:translocation and assembly module TamB